MLMENKQAMILCGGKGTGLWPITNYIQKTMLPIGPMDKPILEYIVRLLKRHKIYHIIMAIDYKGDQIKNYFDNGDRFGVNISYSERGKLHGTGNAILEIKEELFCENFFVYYGDTISNINLSKMMRFHKRNESSLTLALTKGIPIDYGIVEVEGKKIRKFVEKPTLPRAGNIGIYILNKQVLNLLRLKYKKTEVDLSRDIIPYILKKTNNCYGYFIEDFWYDIESVTKYGNLKDINFEKNLSFL